MKKISFMKSKKFVAFAKKNLSEIYNKECKGCKERKKN